ncbi:DUF6895 family protein [Mitsuaria sp. 7]|uniref:DUF6895 family protein n=1 Tax=Mitsuaria sp. 7 TaxID=1658665 RepID=UPI0012FA6D94|nr:hypothetical protein [Mitsuaria sp. 7]
MNAVVPMPAVRPMVGRRSVAARRRDDLLGRVHLAVRLTRRSLKAAVAAEEESAEERSATNGPDRPAALVLGKVVGEAAMLLRTTAPLRGEDETLDVEARLLAVQLVAQARGPRVRERLCNDAGCALEHASAHLFLGDAGYPDGAFDRLLREFLDGNEACGPERLPNHQLECAWLDQIRRGRVDVEPIDEELLMSTCIAWPLDVLGCSTLDLYLFTHVVMYASDMGRRPVHLPRPVAEILAEAEAGLAAALDADNFDLAAELLWTWPMLRQPWSPVAAFAFDVLARVQDEQAFLPGPDYAQWAEQVGHGLAHEDVVMRTSYHATLVMGMLCAVALQSGMALPSALPLAARPHSMGHGAGVDLLDRLPPRALVPRWQRDLLVLEARERAALSSLCFSVWFRRAAAANDIARLRDALAATLEHDDSDGPSAHQALRRLQRITAIGRLQAETMASRCMAPSPACGRGQG